MPTLRAQLQRISTASDEEVAWLTLLEADWQLIADLAFSDLVLMTEGAEGWRVAGHVRPTSAGTLFERDILGNPARPELVPLLNAALRDGKPVEQEFRSDRIDGTANVLLVPVRMRASTGAVRDEPVAVLARLGNVAQAASAGPQELAYRELSQVLLEMVAEGDFPSRAAGEAPPHGAPRVSDGIVRLDRGGKVTFASPNAVSAFTRLGFRDELEGALFAEVVAAVTRSDSEIDATLPLLVTGRAPWRTDLEARGRVLTLRSIPLRQGDIRQGAIVLCRDVTEGRQREQRLITKDATIREIHHRVKNNLQTVAALLRIQSRRVVSDEAKEALASAERRVAAIAVVHDTLSSGLTQSVNFDEVLDRTMRLASEVATADSPRVAVERTGSFGQLPSGYATPLALAITELVSNAVEHGVAGMPDARVEVHAERAPELLTVQVCDNGRGLPADGVGQGLGTQIVRSLLTGELSGTIDWAPGEDAGTTVTLRVPLPVQEDEAR